MSTNPTSVAKHHQVADEARGSTHRTCRSAGTIAAVLLLATAVGCEPAPGPTVGESAPAFSARTLDGGSTSLAELRGEVVLLNVWATWCYPCRHEMPSFQRLHDELAHEGLRVVAVSIDPRGAEEEIERFLSEHGITFDILHDPGSAVTRTFRTTGVPETFLIDRNGVVVRRWIGMIDARSPGVRGAVHAALDGRPVPRPGDSARGDSPDPVRGTDS
jgi:cytochrome c biogenesis protein CcmG, thiol:disulfide interchange protein DsbE